MISWPAVLLLLTIAVSAVVMTALLRAAGLARGAILGGAFVGVLFGATVTGRLAPETYESLLLGGRTQRLALDELLSKHAADVTALRATGVTGVAIDEWCDEHKHREKETHARAALDEARDQFQQPQKRGLIMLAIALLIAAMPRARATTRWADAVFASLWTVLAGGCVLGALALLIFQCTGAQAIALAMTFVVCGSPVGRSSRASHENVVVGSAEAVNQLISTSFLVWLIGLIIGLAFLLGIDTTSANSPIRSSTINTALPMGAVFGVTVLMISSRWRTFLLAEVLTPILAALVVLHIDVLGGWFIAAAIFGLVIGGDARWLGLASGLHWTGWPWGGAFVLSIPLVDTGAVQLALAALLAASAVFSAPLLATAVVGAIVCDLTYPLRPRLLKAFFAQQAEEEDH